MNDTSAPRPIVPYLTASREFEPRWQDYWIKTNVFHADPIDFTRPKQVILDFFPYPSGIGLHVGHPLGYIATDVVARAKRMQGYNVLYSMGFDSFGLPAEQYAVQNNRHPRDTTNENVTNMLSQLRQLGLSHDEARRFLTSEPTYYKWTQWIFLVLYDSVWDPVAEWKDGLGRSLRGRAVSAAEMRRLLEAGARYVDRTGKLTAANAPGARRAKGGEIDELVDAYRLAQLQELEVNWCPMLGTVLANEEVSADGRSERGNHPVYRRPLRQWVLRITFFADRLEEDLSLLDWPTGIVEMQRNWIGRRDGAYVEFKLEGRSDTIRVFTTRPDTVYGVTFLAIAANHPLANALVEEADSSGLDQLIRESASGAGEIEAPLRGLQLKAFAIHPLTNERVPVFATSYVLSDYGTGAVMGVPAHDQRDFEFAKHFGLPIRAVIRPDDRWLIDDAPAATAEGVENELLELYSRQPAAFAAAYEGYGEILAAPPNPKSLWSLENSSGRRAIVADIEKRGCGEATRSYRLRDWIFSRQRYWGEPFPVVYDVDGRVYPLADSELPVQLPPMANFTPITSEDPSASVHTPLEKATDWVTVWGTVAPDGRVVLTDPSEPNARMFRRDANTMPNWAGSCWYYLRYFDPNNDTAFVGPEAECYWSGGTGAIGAVDLYVGGAEHAVLHLLYARFWHKVLYDRGLVSTCEPFAKLFSQGMITADAYQDRRGFYVDPIEVELAQENGTPVAFHKGTRERLAIVIGKMGKRYKNGVPPEDVVARHSTDAYRCYMMFLGPLDASSPWREEPIVGIDRFLSAVWQLAHGALGDAVDPDVDAFVHRTIRDVTADIQELRLNTAVASLMKLSNRLSDADAPPARTHVETLVKLLAPFAPHLAEELFHTRFVLPSGVRSIVNAPWPTFDPSKTVLKRQVIVVQVNGRVRAKVEMDTTLADTEVEAVAKLHPSVARFLDGKTVRNVFRNNRGESRLVNFVTD